MRHITEGRLEELEWLLARLREVDGLTERKRGVFYRRSRAFLHFHEDPTGLFADVRFEGPEFERFDVTRRRDQAQLAKRIRVALEA